MSLTTVVVPEAGIEAWHRTETSIGRDEEDGVLDKMAPVTGEEEVAVAEASVADDRCSEGPATAVEKDGAMLEFELCGRGVWRGGLGGFQEADA